MTAEWKNGKVDDWMSPRRVSRKSSRPVTLSLSKGLFRSCLEHRESRLSFAARDSGVSSDSAFASFSRNDAPGRAGCPSPPLRGLQSIPTDGTSSPFRAWSVLPPYRSFSRHGAVGHRALPRPTAWIRLRMTSLLNFSVTSIYTPDKLIVRESNTAYIAQPSNLPPIPTSILPLIHSSNLPPLQSSPL